METKAPNTCVACKETSEQVGLHYARMLCNGCRAFFKRTVQGKVKISQCRSEGQCVVDQGTRKLCKSCRFEACKRAGVDSTKVQQPKEESTEVTTLDQQFGYVFHTDNDRLLPSTSFRPQSAFQPYYFTAQGSQMSQNMCAIPPVINFQAPSIGIGGFSQNLTANLGSHQVANPHVFLDNQPPVHYTSGTAASMSPMHIWASPSNGGFLSAGYPSRESNNDRFPSSSSVIFPYGSSLDTGSSSTSVSYTDMAKYMGSSLFYNPHSASTSQYGALSYPNMIPQPASAIANHASFSGSQPLASSWADRQDLNRLDRNALSASIHDSVLASQATSYLINNFRQDLIRSVINTAPFSAEAHTKDNRHDVVTMYQRDNCKTETGSIDVKKEIDYSCKDSGCSDSLNDVNDTLDNATPEPQLHIENQLEVSQMRYDNKQLPLDATYLFAASFKHPEEVTRVRTSEKSSAFMMDMLLKPQQQTLLPRKDERKTVDSGLANAHALSISSQRGDNNTEETNESPYKTNNNFREKSCRTMTVNSYHIDPQNSDFVRISKQHDTVLYQDNGRLRTENYKSSSSEKNAEREMMRSSTPNHPECEQSLDDTLEEIDVYNTDEDIRLNQLNSNHGNTEETFYTGSTNSANAEDASKSEHEKLTKNKCLSDSEDIVKTTECHQINSSLGLNQSHGVSSGDSEDIVKTTECHQINSSLGLYQSHGVSSGDSGLGRSSHVSTCDLQKTQPGSVETMKAADNYNNNENVRVTPPKKRRTLSQSEESNTRKTKKIKLNNHSFTTTTYTRNHLRDISENGANKMNNHENSPSKLSVPLAPSSDFSSEDEAAMTNTQPRPQFTSTPITCASINKSRFFLNVMCEFAKYCQIEQTTTPEKHAGASVKRSPNKSSPSKEPSSPAGLSDASFDQLASSENKSNKLERLEGFQRIVMTKVRSVDTYTMTEFKADVLKLNFLAQDAVRHGQLKF